MIILGCDLGIANLAVSCLTDKLDVLFAKNFTTTSKTEHRYRLSEIEVFINEVLTNYKPDVIVYEKNYCQLTDAGSALINVEGILLTTSTKYDVKVVTNYSAKQVKKKVTGNGNSSKEQMIATANKLFNLTNKNNHVADSLLIGYCYLLDNKLT
jgi:crossover junction endodeoxyribonuclease RuvC